MTKFEKCLVTATFLDPLVRVRLKGAATAVVFLSTTTSPVLKLREMVVNEPSTFYTNMILSTIKCEGWRLSIYIICDQCFMKHPISVCVDRCNYCWTQELQMTLWFACKSYTCRQLLGKPHFLLTFIYLQSSHLKSAISPLHLVATSLRTSFDFTFFYFLYLTL